MNEPNLQLSLKLADLDLNVGVSKNMNVTVIIEDLIRSILKDIMVSIPLLLHCYYCSVSIFIYLSIFFQFFLYSPVVFALIEFFMYLLAHF